MLAIVGALVLAVFVLPAPWGWVVVGVAFAFEVAEKVFWVRYTRRIPVGVGREAMIGLPVTVVSVCRPEGRVMFSGERWSARCAAGAGVGERLVVEAVEQLTLVCRPASALRDEPAT